MHKTYVTSMSRGIYDNHGQEMLETFSKYWPRGQLHVYVEEGELPLEDKRITYHPLDEVPGLMQFIGGLQHMPVCHGVIGEQYDYRHNLVAFVKKVYAQCAAALLSPGYLFWIDADVVTDKHIPGVMLDRWMQGAFSGGRRVVLTTTLVLHP